MQDPRILTDIKSLRDETSRPSVWTWERSSLIDTTNAPPLSLAAPLLFNLKFSISVDTHLHLSPS